MDTATTAKDKLRIDTSDFFFRKLFYESKDLFLIFDFEYDKTIDVNESTLAFSGYSRDEFMKLSRFEMTPQFSDLSPNIDLHKTFLESHAQKVLNGETIVELGIFKKKDGTDIFAELEIIPTDRKKGEAFIIIKDLTDNIKKKTKYKETERNYRSIVESAAAAITIVDLKGNHIFVSPQIEKITGYTPEEMTGTPTHLYFAKGEDQKLKSYSRKLLLNQKVEKSTILEARHKDGHSIWVQGNATLLTYKNGKPKAIQTIFLDVSEKILLEKELERTNDKYQQIIENIQGVVMFVDLQGLIQYVSPTYSSITGYDSKEVIGKKGLFIFCEEDTEKIKQHSLRLLNGESESYTSTYKAYHKDGSVKWVKGTFSLFRDKLGEPAGFVSVYLDDTKKVLTELELEKTKYKYQHIIENLNGVITITELDGNTSYASPKLYEALGYQPEEVIGQSGKILFFEEEHQRLTKYAQNLFSKTSQRIQQTYRGKHKDGSERWINGIASVTKNKQGIPTGFVTIFFDITQELALQQQLVSSEDRYEALFENSIDPIVVRELKTLKVIECNNAAIEFFGLENKKDIEKLNEFSEKVSDKSGQSFKEIVSEQIKIAQTESKATFQVNYEGDNERAYIIEINLTIDSTDPSMSKCVFFLKDITERVMAFEKIAKERELLNAVIEGTADKILVQDKDRKVIAINSNFSDYFVNANGSKVTVGTDMKLMAQKYMTIEVADKDKWEKKISSVLEGETIAHQYQRKINNKKEHFSMSASPLKNKSDEISGIISVSRNITELVEKNEEIEEKNKELQKYLDSNIQLENFAYVASHDLKQPLRTIISFSELLHSKKADQLDEDANKYINFILESSQRLNALISDMLAYSVIGTAGKKEAINPKIIIPQVLNDLSAQINQSNATIEIGKLPSTIMVFKSEFISLIQNLVSNSVKYCKEDINPEIKISSHDAGDKWKFSIADNGQGIKQEHLKRIFGMFQRLEVNTKTSGTGIGLAHCKKILELHKGEIWAESEFNVGTIFNFTIPK